MPVFDATALLYFLEPDAKPPLGCTERCFTGEPRYVRGALDEREPPFEQDAIQYNLKRLLERAEVPG